MFCHFEMKIFRFVFAYTFVYLPVFINVCMQTTYVYCAFLKTGTLLPNYKNTQQFTLFNRVNDLAFTFEGVISLFVQYTGNNQEFYREGNPYSSLHTSILLNAAI